MNEGEFRFTLAVLGLCFVLVFLNALFHKGYQPKWERRSSGRHLRLIREIERNAEAQEKEDPM